MSFGKYADDWVARSVSIGALADKFYFYSREDGHWSNELEVATLHPLSLPSTRAALMDTPIDLHHLAMNFDYGQLDGSDYETMHAAASRLDAAEKIVISATAWSLCNLDNPPELTIDLMNLLFEEALHLEAVGRFLGIEHGDREWIPDDREGNWNLVKTCGTPVEYMMIEHCLYEGRGTVASAGGVYELERAGAPRSVTAVMEAVAKQECNHNITGYRWLKLLETNSEQHERILADAVRRFIAEEPLPAADGSARSARKFFPLYLLQRYRESHDFLGVKQDIVAASRAARATGGPGVSTDELYARAEQLLEWCDQL